MTKSNEELRRAYSELEAKYEALAGMHNRPTGKGGAAASGAPAGAGADDGRREDPARRRSYNVRKYQGYPRPPSPPAPYADPPPPRGHVGRRTATADDRFCRTCGDPLSAPTAEYGKVTEDSAGARWQVTHWTVTRRYWQALRQAAVVAARRRPARRALRNRRHVQGRDTQVHDRLV